MSGAKHLTHTLPGAEKNPVAQDLGISVIPRGENTECWTIYHVDSLQLGPDGI